MDTFDNNFESISDSNSFLPSFLRAAKIEDWHGRRHLLRIETKRGAKGVMMMHTAQERPSDGSRKDDCRPDRYFLIEPPYKYRRLLSSGSTSKGGAMPAISNFQVTQHSTAQPGFVSISRTTTRMQDEAKSPASSPLLENQSSANR